VNAQGCLVDRLEGRVTVKFIMENLENDNIENGSLFSAQVQCRYRFHEKFAAGLRFAFTADNDMYIQAMYGNTGMNLGLVGEYNPTPFTYIRLEAGMLSFSNSDDELMAKQF